MHTNLSLPLSTLSLSIQNKTSRLSSVLPTKWQRNSLRFLLVLFTFLVASTIHQFGLITAFVGAITDTLQGFILPPLIYAATFAAALTQREKVSLVGISAVGVVLMLSATYQNAGELERLSKVQGQR